MKPEWMLTKEEFEEAIDKKTLYPNHMIDQRIILKAQVLKLVEWGDTICENPNHNTLPTQAYRRFDCIWCMTELKKEVQGE